MNRDKIARVLDDVMDIIETERGTVAGMFQDKSTPKLSRLKHLDLSHLLTTEEEGFVFGLKETTPAVIWPIQVGVAMQTDDGHWNFVIGRTASPKEVRGRARIVTPKMLWTETVGLYPDGRSFGGVEIMAWANGKWVDASGKVVHRSNDVARLLPADGDHFDGKGHMLLAAALRHRYEWSVSIGRDGGPSFRFATDVTGIRELVKQRDKGEAGRRDALRAWVSDHWRQSRHDPEEEVYVRKHLRGSEAFSWRGYQCEWRPSQFDAERNDAFRAEREMMGRQAIRPSRKVVLPGSPNRRQGTAPRT